MDLSRLDSNIPLHSFSLLTVSKIYSRHRRYDNIKFTLMALNSRSCRTFHGWFLVTKHIFAVHSHGHIESLSNIACGSSLGPWAILPLAQDQPYFWLHLGNRLGPIFSLHITSTRGYSCIAGPWPGRFTRRIAAKLRAFPQLAVQVVLAGTLLPVQEAERRLPCADFWSYEASCTLAPIPRTKSLCLSHDCIIFF